MNLDQVTIEIRPRNPWEAVDLGLLMARRWWWPLTRIWLLVTLPLFLLLNLLPQGWLWLSYTLVWWCKPLFERPLLFLLSHAVFGEMPDTRTALRAFPALAGRQWFASLTWRRLSPSRSMDLPVLQLEDLGGSRRQERISLLHREGSGPAIWLTIIGVHLETFMALGFFLLLYALIPSEVDIDLLSLFTDPDFWFEHLVCLGNYLAMALVAPFYVACGFSLYLNRRITLEAWDIDIAFRRILAKRRATTGLASLLVLLAGLGLFSPLPVEAQTDAAPASELPYTRESAKSHIQEVLRGDDFERTQTHRYPVFFDRESTGDKAGEDDDSPFLDWLQTLFEYRDQITSVAKLLEICLWLAVAALILLLILRYRHWLAAYLPRSVVVAEPPRPVTLFGMDVTRESLPEDVSNSALALLQAGDYRGALALLYRASLSRLLDAGLDIEDGHTEEECLHLARIYSHKQSRASSAVRYFASLTRAWQRLAYGHLAPEPHLAEELCRHWNQAWQLDPPEEQAHG